MLSPRVAPQMIGLGLLEAVPAADILALADPDVDPTEYDTDGYYVGRLTDDGCRITARWMSTTGGGEPVGQGNLLLQAIDPPHCPPLPIRD